MKQQFLSVPTLAAAAFVKAETAGNFMTEVTLTPLPGKNEYQFEVRFSKVNDLEGNPTADLIAAPRIVANCGQKAVLRSEIPNGPAISVEVFYPEAGAGEYATCSVLATEQKKVASWSKFRLKLGDSISTERAGR